MMSVLFCKENVEIIQHVFMVCSEILPLYGIILVCIFIGKKKQKYWVGFNVNDVLFGEMPFSGCNKFVNL